MLGEALRQLRWAACRCCLPTFCPKTRSFNRAVPKGAFVPCRVLTASQRLGGAGPAARAENANWLFSCIALHFLRLFHPPREAAGLKVGKINEGREEQMILNLKAPSSGESQHQAIGPCSLLPK